jgi:hypothetical protein
VIADRCALKKSWAKDNKPTYVVDLLYDERSGYYQVWKTWGGWKDKVTGDTVQGTGPYKSSTDDPKIAAVQYMELLRDRVEDHQYKIVERVKTKHSPLQDISTCATVATVKEAAEEKPKKASRTGSCDWW